VQVLVLCLVFCGISSLAARPPNEGCKRDGCPNDKYVEPVDNRGSQAPRFTIGPPTYLQQIVSLPYFDIYILPLTQPRIQDYREILDQHRAVETNFKKVLFKEIREFPSPCEFKPIFVGIIEKPDLVPCL
jgi:hypothetical protein